MKPSHRHKARQGLLSTRSPTLRRALIRTRHSPNRTRTLRSAENNSSCRGAASDKKSTRGVFCQAAVYARHFASTEGCVIRSHALIRHHKKAASVWVFNSSFSPMCSSQISCGSGPITLAILCPDSPLSLVPDTGIDISGAFHHRAGAQVRKDLFLLLPKTGPKEGWPSVKISNPPATQPPRSSPGNVWGL